MKRHVRSIVIFLSAALILGFSAPAQSTDNPGDTGWRFDLLPLYIWGVNLDGDVTLGMPAGISSNRVKVSFDDIFSNLEAAFIFHLEGTKDNRWGFFLDYNYLNISGDASLP